jgi:DNA polymerase III epsilon subunit-like protein
MKNLHPWGARTLNGYAVFDIETTGFRLHPDSIVEIAVVHVDAAGQITGAWDTLLHPRDGDAGPTHVHGITADMVRDAPSFSDVAAELYGLFADRTPVAHRIAQFDGRFLNAHFTASGIETDAFTKGLCTWQLAHRHLPLAHHKLEDCCTHLGIDLVDAHQALTDTIATAQLLGHFIRAGLCPADPARAIPPQATSSRPTASPTAPPPSAAAGHTNDPDPVPTLLRPRRPGSVHLPTPAAGR